MFALINRDVFNTITNLDHKTLVDSVLKLNDYVSMQDIIRMQLTVSEEQRRKQVFKVKKMSVNLDPGATPLFDPNSIDSIFERSAKTSHNSNEEDLNKDTIKIENKFLSFLVKQ